MSDRNNNDLAALLTPAPSRGVQFSQAKVLTWDNETLHNTLEWRGITITDVPLVEGINALVIRPGDVVGMLGWAPENAKGVGTWWILGKLSNPGEFVADLNVTAKIFRFVTEDEHTLAFFGKESDGDPFWALYYGESDEQAAIKIVNADYISITDRSGFEVVSTDGESRVGLADPWIPYLINPTINAEIQGTVFVPTTTSAAFVPIWRGNNPLYHPRIAYGFTVSATGTTEWELRINTGAGETTVATGSGSANSTFLVPGWGTTVVPGTIGEILLYGRNTGGGFSRFAFSRLYGRQS